MFRQAGFGVFGFALRVDEFTTSSSPFNGTHGAVDGTREKLEGQVPGVRCFDSAVLVSVFFVNHEGIMGPLW